MFQIGRAPKEFQTIRENMNLSDSFDLILVDSIKNGNIFQEKQFQNFDLKSHGDVKRSVAAVHGVKRDGASARNTINCDGCRERLRRC